MTIIESQPLTFEETLADLINDALQDGESVEGVMSALELQLIALEEELKSDDRPG
jgi:hypothetical protein